MWVAFSDFPVSPNYNREIRRIKVIVFKVPREQQTARPSLKNLYKTYSGLMYATVLRHDPRLQDCKDIVRTRVESFCKKVHTAYGRCQPCPDGYIVYTVKNRARNFKRHQTSVEKHIRPDAKRQPGLRNRRTRRRRQTWS